MLNWIERAGRDNLPLSRVRLLFPVPAIAGRGAGATECTAVRTFLQLPQPQIRKSENPLRVRLPIPSNWQDFEALCHQLWKDIWGDHGAQRNGRAGQPQNGVDIFGRPYHAAGYAGVQCKDKDARLGSELKEAELLEECRKARGFVPQLQSFTLATTAPRDAGIQTIARCTTVDGTFPFEVHVWSWDDIEAEVASRPFLRSAFYGSEPSGEDCNDITIAITAPKDQFVAFFGRPAITSAIGPGVRNEVMQLAYELCDNAFRHGKANRVRLSFVGTTLLIADNGMSFDSTRQLHDHPPSLESHMGTLALDMFKQVHPEIGLSYAREQRGPSQENQIRIDFNDLGLYVTEPESCEVLVDVRQVFGRTGAQGVAAGICIPQGIHELVLVISTPVFYSMIAELVRCVLARLPQSVKLVLSYPKSTVLAGFEQVLTSYGVELRAR